MSHLSLLLAQTANTPELNIKKLTQCYFVFRKMAYANDRQK